MMAVLLGSGASLLRTPKPSSPLGAAPLGIFLLLLVSRIVDVA